MKPFIVSNLKGMWATAAEEAFSVYPIGAANCGKAPINLSTSWAVVTYKSTFGYLRGISMHVSLASFLR